MKPGKSVEIPKEDTDTADDRLHADLSKTETLLELLRVEDRKLTKAQRLGKYEKVKRNRERYW